MQKSMEGKFANDKLKMSPLLHHLLGLLSPKTNKSILESHTTAIKRLLPNTTRQ